MAKGRKTGGRDFQKGNKHGGRPQLPDEIKSITRDTKPQVIAAYWKISNLTPAQADKYKPTNYIESGILKTLKEFARTGKTDNIRHLWAECHGKPRESVDISSGVPPLNIQVHFVDALEE